MHRNSSVLPTRSVYPAGATHAMSGIAEAFLDGIPMPVISGGIRRDTGKSYQLHDIDQIALMKNVTKGAWLVEHHRDIVPVLFKAYQIAVNGVPGPVFVKIPGNHPLHEVRLPAEFFRGVHQNLYGSHRPGTIRS
ncbi:MAG: thiamine pyrophosphate-binding protein [Cyclonatronaceae bacterium]